ncbi:hypothetical protein [Sphingomonas bacterium]|uniref:hypothetical protein n=1 Tax=Sphingomonas bacterium TaxID=1895847 RepID=UPI0015772AD3|nr:hypothetical protein [Sphingomonas bacterium]
MHGHDPIPYARELARGDAAAAEAIIDALVTRSIEGWRLADATFWQRVRYRSRLFRAHARRDDAAGQRAAS